MQMYLPCEILHRLIPEDPLLWKRVLKSHSGFLILIGNMISIRNKYGCIFDSVGIFRPNKIYVLYTGR